MQKLFALEPDLIYLNHAAISPWPIVTQQAVYRFAAENMQSGAKHYTRWMEVEQRLRKRMQKLINAPSQDDIALLKNTSECLSMVAYGLDWKAGDRIVTVHEEFPSNRFVWDSLGPRYGVMVDKVSMYEYPDLEAALIERLTPATRLLSVSAVQYINGKLLDMERLGEACKKRGCLFLVDAIQILGALPFDVQAIQADFVAADGHKWMLGPEGIALFYCREELRESIRLSQIGWHSIENSNDYDQQEYELAHSARRFECGSPNMLGIHALDASLGLLQEQGMENVAAALRERIEFLLHHLPAGYELLTPRNSSQRAGIINIKPEKNSPHEIFSMLQQRQVLCAVRGGGIRLSPHFYTPVEQLQQVCQWLQQAG